MASINSLVSQKYRKRIKKAPIVSSGAFLGGNGFYIAGSRYVNQFRDRSRGKQTGYSCSETQAEIDGFSN